MRSISTFLSAFCLLFASLALAEPLDLNTASVEQLASTLDGVGESKAQAIVAWRETHGPFQRVEELLEVKGIGENTLQKNRGRMAVSIQAE